MRKKNKEQELSLTGLSLYGQLQSTVAVIKTNLDNLIQRFEDFKDEIDGFVTDKEFEPVKNIVYGFVSLILVSVAGALIALVVIK